MPTLKKIFKPDIMFNDFIKSCWCDNLKLNEQKKLTIHKELKLNGIYALNIEPLQDKKYFVFCLPINKNWTNEDLTKWKEPYLCFDIIGCDRFKLNIQIMSDKNDMLQKQDIQISEIEDWNKMEIPLVKNTNAKTVSFSGSSSIANILMKDIVIKDK